MNHYTPTELSDKLDRIESAIRFIAMGENSSVLTVVDEILNPKKPLTLAQKFEDYRSKQKHGKGFQYWRGLEKIAEDHYINTIEL
jgi:uncharacterized protein YdeI (YjbR/CyaY-like superfamily)